MTNRWYDLLHERERKMARDKCAPNHVADLSQCDERDVVGDGCCPCVTPGAIFFDYDLMRLYLPVERCALQGITFPRSLLSEFSHTFWNDLSGNAFCCPVFIAILNALFIVLGKEFTTRTIANPLARARAEDVEQLLSDGMSGHDLSMCDFSELLSGVDMSALLP